MSNKFLPFLLSVLLAAGLACKFLPEYFYNIGKADFERKNYEKAFVHLGKAYDFNKNNQDYRYYYVQTMLKLKPNKKVQQKLFEISTDKKKDSAHTSAERQIKKWRYNVLQNIGNNYIEQVPLNNKIVRWSKFPIKISIINNSGTNVPEYYRTEVLRAFSLWQGETKFLQFEEVNNPSDAVIVIEIKKLPDNVCEGKVCRYVLGFTTPEYSGSHLNKMNIVLYDQNPYGKFFTDRELFNTVLHEIGHALGIMGHSYNSNDVMYMSAEDNIYKEDRSYFQYLSEQDINTIKLLYKLIPDITDAISENTKNLVYAPIVLGTEEDISNRKVEEAKNYIKNAPDLSGGYMDLGIAYSELNRTDEAIEAMQKAYSLAKNDNEKYLCLFNLSVINFNSENPQKALEYALMAQKISDTPEIRELISKIK